MLVLHGLSRFVNLDGLESVVSCPAGTEGENGFGKLKCHRTLLAKGYFHAEMIPTEANSGDVYSGCTGHIGGAR